MRRLLLGFIFLTAFTIGLKGQNSFNLTIDNFRFKKITEGTYTARNLKLSDIQGTPYLENQFVPGKIITTNGTSNENIPLRYNAYTDDLEFKKGEDIFNIDPKSIVKRAEFGKSIFSYFPYFYGGKIEYRFFRILTEGNATLLVRYSVMFLEKEEVKAYADPKPARFDTVQQEYFIAFGDLPAKPFSNKKSLIELFGDKKGEMESYMSKNKLSVKGDEPLIKIIAYYNSL